MSTRRSDLVGHQVKLLLRSLRWAGGWLLGFRAWRFRGLGFEVLGLRGSVLAFRRSLSDMPGEVMGAWR